MPCQPRTFLRRWAGWPPLLVLLAATGCGPSVGKVSGKVYYKNTLLKGGTVSFVGSNKESRVAEISEDGTYKVEKVPVGEATICVETASFKPSSVKAPQYKPPAGVEAPGGYKPPDRAARAKRYLWIPPDYAEPAKSKLRYTVASGSQDYDIKMD